MELRVQARAKPMRQSGFLHIEASGRGYRPGANDLVARSARAPSTPSSGLSQDLVEPAAPDQTPMGSALAYVL